MQGMGPGQGFWTLLTRDERDALSSLGLPRDYPAGATMCLEGDPAPHVFILLAGWVKILSATKDGQEIVVALRGAGELVGEIGPETGRRTATIQAIDAVHALIVRYDKFRSFLDTNLGAGHAYRRVVTQRWNDTDTIPSRTGTSGGQRSLACCSIWPNGTAAGKRRDPPDDAVVAGGAGQPGRHLHGPPSRGRSATGAKRGLIRTGQRRITIVDVPGLQRIAGRPQ